MIQTSIYILYSVATTKRQRENATITCGLYILIYIHGPLEVGPTGQQMQLWEVSTGLIPSFFLISLLILAK